SPGRPAPPVPPPAKDGSRKGHAEEAAGQTDPGEAGLRQRVVRQPVAFQPRRHTGIRHPVIKAHVDVASLAGRHPVRISLHSTSLLVHVAPSEARSGGFQDDNSSWYRRIAAISAVKTLLAAESSSSDKPCIASWEWAPSGAKNARAVARPESE